MSYYPDYVPKNATHFRDMLNQFRNAPTKADMDLMAALWTMGSDADRQDIVVALGRAEREGVRGPAAQETKP